jgi:hypothetical protein
MKGSHIEIGKSRINAEYLRSVSEKKAILDFKHLETSKVVNAWKQANGLTVRNNKKSKKAIEKKVEKSTKNKD